jgi:hypothetical protein|tara:strand:- start:1407 stop:1619 length:213 start_codon:yes stop_codon:yes gene_type:complete
MKWLATALFLSAGTLLSLNIEISRFGFLLFLAGHVLLSWYFYKEKDWAMTTQNGFFIFIDALGIYRWFLI